ncbi:MAG: NTP/NDP exchange transporter [Oligoflexales bacterium]|nr:NTP/NDP exchange transporter [Oligoflexales bacterium]
MQAGQKSSTPNFGKIRAFFWPIMGSELKKFLPMAFMQFLIIFIYTILRNTKDALVISEGGAAVIPFLKGYVVFPASILFVIGYGKLVDSLSKKAVFYTVVTFFLSFFTLFAFVFFPFKTLFHPSAEFVLSLKQSYPALTHFFSIFQTWTYSLFYVMSELWGSVMNALLFWQFANEITKTEEAKRFYAMFILLANFSMILSGISVKVFSMGSTLMMVQLICGVTLLGGIGICYLYRWVHTHVLTDRRFFNPDEQEKKPKKAKVKLSVFDSFRMVLSSSYLMMIALLVLCYGISINLIELLWKNQMNIQFPNPTDYNSFMGYYSSGTGIATILVILTSKSVITRFGWFWGAIVTPFTILITGLIFFACVLFSDLMDPLVSMMGVNSLLVSVWIGTIQNVLSKSVKYGLFDPTKEMAYIPLDYESRAKGKAAVEVLGGRLGKAGGGYLSSGLLMLAATIGWESSVTSIAPILSLLIIAVIVIWIYAVFTLNKLYQKAVQSPGSQQ